MAPWEIAGATPAPAGPVALDPDYYQRIAKVESNGNPLAVNKSTGASGLYQWMPATAKQYGITDPFNKDQNEAGIKRFTADNLSQLSRSIDRAPTSAEAYLAHQQGAGGAAKLLNNPDAKAVDIVGKDAVILNGGSPDMSAADFAKMVENKYSATDPNAMGNSAAGFANRALEPYSGVTTFRGGRGAAGPGEPRYVSGNGPAQQAVKDFGVGLAHGGIDVPANSAASGATWLAKQFGYGDANDAVNAHNDKYNQDYAANSAGNSWGGTLGNLTGGAATAALTTPAVGGLLLRGALGGGIGRESSTHENPAGGVLVRRVSKHA
jgi:hypothetical protein